jgi:hypothetical protein
MGIYVVDGRDGRIFTGTLPSGDYTIKGAGDEWHLLKAKYLKKSHFLRFVHSGEWLKCN